MVKVCCFPREKAKSLTVWIERMTLSAWCQCLKADIQSPVRIGHRAVDGMAMWRCEHGLWLGMCSCSDALWCAVGSDGARLEDAGSDSWKRRTDRKMNQTLPPVLGPLSLCTSSLKLIFQLLSGVNSVILLPVWSHYWSWGLEA